jgi:hypothetical protein
VSLPNAYRSLLDRYRGMLDGTWGLRLYSVTVRVNAWSGTLPGQQGATKTPTETPLLAGGGRPRVEQVSQRDVIASAGLYEEQDLRIGPLTPAFTDPATGAPGGIDPSLFDPLVNGGPTEVLFRVDGPGLPAAWYKKVGTEIIPGNFRYCFVVRKTGEQGV